MDATTPLQPAAAEMDHLSGRKRRLPGRQKGDERANLSVQIEPFIDLALDELGV